MSNKRKKQKVEYHYHEMPVDSYVFALLGQEWIQTYGRDGGGLHMHNHLEIGYCYYGTGRLVLEEEDFVFGGHALLLVPPNVPHAINSDEGTVSRWEYLYIDAESFLKNECGVSLHFAEGFLNRIYSRALYINEKEHPTLARIVKELLEELRKKDEYYRQSVKGLLLQLLIEMARMNKERIQKNRSSSQYSEMLEKAMDYISTNYKRPIKIETLADECGISETHFRRLFGEAMHMTPVEYINHVRIQAACELLRRTGDPIMDIAERVGFPIPSTFNRNFKRQLGVSPCEWRNRFSGKAKSK